MVTYKNHLLSLKRKFGRENLRYIVFYDKSTGAITQIRQTPILV
jgi:hypothetical protein